MRCSVKNCNNSNKKTPCAISFFNFPTDPSLLKQWKSFCLRDSKMNVKHSQICMEHFKEDDFENNLKYKLGFTKKRILKKTAVPTVRKKSSADEERYKARAQRIEKRENKKIVEMLIKEYDAESDLLNEKSSEQSMQPIIAEVKQHDVKSYSLNDVSEQSMQPIITEALKEPQLYPASEVVSDPQKRIILRIQYDINNIKRLKMELERLRKENSALRKTSKKQAAKLSEKEDKNYYLVLLSKEVKIYSN